MPCAAFASIVAFAISAAFTLGIPLALNSVFYGFEALYKVAAVSGLAPLPAVLLLVSAGTNLFPHPDPASSMHVSWLVLCAP